MREALYTVLLMCAHTVHTTIGSDRSSSVNIDSV
jgi:hypothetical protein